MSFSVTKSLQFPQTSLNFAYNNGTNVEVDSGK